jgi:phosphatidate cytidylyltransferase
MLISDPLASPYWWPLLGVLGSVLGGSLPALLLAGRRAGARSRGLLLRRWGVWAAIAPVFVLALLGGGLPLALVLALVAGQGLREYGRLVSLPPAWSGALAGAGAITPLVALLWPALLPVLPFGLLLLATLPLLAGAGGLAGVRHLAFAALGWGYVAGLLTHAVLLYQSGAGGPGLLLVAAVGTALSDVGAFVVGSRIGGRKLAPALSPNKTWAGLGGNLLGAAAGVALTAFALPAAGRELWLVGLPLLIAGGAVWGDLLESGFKRAAGAKDAGTWLPGFGGLLDRLDSLIVVAPLVYYMWLVVGR